MFNEERKQAYIEYEKVNHTALKNSFKRLSEGETACGKDIADMTKEELVETLKGLGIRREETRGQLLSLLRGYINWCILSGHTKNNPIETITAESLGDKELTARRMIRDKDQVFEILSASTDTERVGENSYCNQPNRAARDRLVFWLLYAGLKIEDMMKLKKTDACFESKTVKCEGGKTYDVDENILSLWKQYADAKHIERTPRRADEAIIKTELLGNDFLFRSVEGDLGKGREVQAPRAFSVSIQRIFANYKEATGIELKVLPNDVITSGAFYRAYLAGKEEGGFSEKTLAKFLGIKYNDEKELKLKMRRWLIDYQDWKAAFSYN
jgi:site-specific recombinase XerC